MSDPPLIVTGTGRSGTSAVARVLHESGVSMGTSFLEASEHNATGYYEDVDARALNMRIMADAGLGDLRLAQELPSREAFLEAAAPYADEQRRIASAGARGWKDPQFCFTLESWLPAFGTPPRVVVCLRGPESYLQSVLEIVGMIERELVQRWWARHLRRLLEVIEAHGLAAHCVEFDRLTSAPEETVAALGRFVRAELDASYVEPSLRRQRGHETARYRALYERVLALGADARA